MDQPENDELSPETLRDFLPAEFGKTSRAANVAIQIEKSKRSEDGSKGQLTKGGGVGNTIQRGSEAETDDDQDDDQDDNSDNNDDDDDEEEFPTSHEVILKTHERSVTTLTMDPSGSRLVTGSTDCTLKFHDLASMTPTTLRAFKSVDPTATKGSAASETHPIHHVEFNPLSAGHLLVISATPQAKVLSRDGDTLTEFIKGDMYLRDMHNTKGHISEITTGTWHPVDRDSCVTAGTDSTLRIWDINNKRSQKEVIVHKSRLTGSGGRTRMTAVAWGSPVQGGPNVLISSALDGTLVMWSGNGPYTRPAAEIRDAHAQNTWTSGLDISADGRLVVTRGGDDTIKTWDTRKFKTPLATISHPSTSSQFPTSSICFSSKASYILTGSVTGHLHFLNPATLKEELVTAVTPGAPLITALWHEKINQIVTGSASSETRILYSPKISTRGAEQIMSKAPKRRHIDDDPSLTTDMSQGLSGDGVINPNGLMGSSNRLPTTFAARHPTVGLTASGRSRDPRRPHMPVQTPFAKSQPDEKHIKEHIPLSSMRDEDPREALLKYATKAEQDPLFTNAWKHTQPKTIYAELSDDETEGQPDQKKTRT